MDDFKAFAVMGCIMFTLYAVIAGGLLAGAAWIVKSVMGC
jgi:hypothetical protein